jgi:predicted nucleotidyltransferase
MRARGWRWYVFGAQAVAAYGRPRLTADVDVTIEPTGAGAGEVIAALDAHGFTLSAEHLGKARLLPMVHVPSGFPLDLVIASPGLDDELLARARWLDLGGVEAPVVSVEDLVVMKVLAGRRKDLEDVRGVLAVQEARIDLGRVRDLLGALESATGERKLLARLERLVRSAAPGRNKRGR